MQRSFSETLAPPSAASPAELPAGSVGPHYQISRVPPFHEIPATSPELRAYRVRRQKNLERPEGRIRVFFWKHDLDWRPLAMTAAHLLGRFKPADDRSLQANDVNGILDVVASEKQVVDLCFRLRSPLPAPPRH